MFFGLILSKRHLRKNHDIDWKFFFCSRRRWWSWDFYPKVFCEISVNYDGVLYSMFSVVYNMRAIYKNIGVTVDWANQSTCCSRTVLYPALLLSIRDNEGIYLSIFSHTVSLSFRYCNIIPIEVQHSTIVFVVPLPYYYAIYRCYHFLFWTVDVSPCVYLSIFLWEGNEGGAPASIRLDWKARSC